MTSEIPATGDRAKVLVAGGGIAGIETALALKDLAGGRVEVEICDPRREFSFRPFVIGEPYGAVRVLRCDLERLSERCGAAFRPHGIASVLPESRASLTRDGERLGYDYLVLAGGVRMLWAIPGAVTFWGAADEGRVGDVLAGLRAGQFRRLAFTMPAGPGWVLPLYELALFAAVELGKAGVTGTALTVVTPERAPLASFGRQVAEGVGARVGAMLREREIEIVTGAEPIRFDHGRLRVAPGEEVEADAVISLPRLEGRGIGGIPQDAGGFVGVDEHGRVSGLGRVFAAGDMTDFPIKQGGIATRQADAVAEAIATEVGSEVEPGAFESIARGPNNGDDRMPGRYLAPFVASLAEEAELELTGHRQRRLRLTRSA